MSGERREQGFLQEPLTTSEQQTLIYAILSNKEILSRYNAGEVIVYPFVEENVKTSSVDVTLGEYYYRPNKDHGIKYYNPWSEDHVSKVYGDFQKAELASKLFGDDLPDGVEPNDKIIVAYPGEILLCHTEEFIGAKSEYTTMMSARSGIGRNDIVVCNCAGWGDVGYFNRWTMEIKTAGFGGELPVVLTVGRRIAQITFLATGPIIKSPYSADGKYQQSEELEILRASWRPEMMLPRLFNDKEVKK